jgi:hypothetical protein
MISGGVFAGVPIPSQLVASRLVDLGGEPFASSPTDFGKFIVEYTEKWGKVIRAAGIKAE